MILLFYCAHRVHDALRPLDVLLAALHLARRLQSLQLHCLLLDRLCRRNLSFRAFRVQVQGLGSVGSAHSQAAIEGLSPESRREDRFCRKARMRAERNTRKGSTSCRQ